VLTQRNEAARLLRAALGFALMRSAAEHRWTEGFRDAMFQLLSD
jgi:hypothetical protein